MRNIYIISSDTPLLQAVQSMTSLRPKFSPQVFCEVDIFWARIASLSPSIVVFDLGGSCAGAVDELKRMKRDAPGFGVIVLTQSGDVQQMVDVMKAGALDVIAQPLDEAMLLAAIDLGLAQLSNRFENAASTVEARRIIATLSQREGQIFTHLLEGQANKVVAYELDLSVRTIEIHRSHVMTKLGVRSMAEACSIAFHAGLFPKSPEQRPSFLEMSNSPVFAAPAAVIA